MAYVYLPDSDWLLLGSIVCEDQEKNMFYIKVRLLWLGSRIVGHASKKRVLKKCYTSQVVVTGQKVFWLELYFHVYFPLVRWLATWLEIRKTDLLLDLNWKNRTWTQLCVYGSSVYQPTNGLLVGWLILSWYYRLLLLSSLFVFGHLILDVWQVPLNVPVQLLTLLQYPVSAPHAIQPATQPATGGSSRRLHPGGSWFYNLALLVKLCHTMWYQVLLIKSSREALS